MGSMAYDTRGQRLATKFRSGRRYGDPYLEGTDALPAFRRIVRQEQLFPVIWTIDHFEHSDRKFVSVNELLTNKCLEP
jgi:hypothetical protein